MELNGTLQLAQLTSDPTSPVEGMVYYNTNTNSIRFYDGSSWNDLSSTPKDLSLGTFGVGNGVQKGLQLTTSSPVWLNVSLDTYDSDSARAGLILPIDGTRYNLGGGGNYGIEMPEYFCRTPSDTSLNFTSANTSSGSPRNHHINNFISSYTELVYGSGLTVTAKKEDLDPATFAGGGSEYSGAEYSASAVFASIASNIGVSSPYLTIEMTGIDEDWVVGNNVYYPFMRIFASAMSASNYYMRVYLWNFNTNQYDKIWEQHNQSVVFEMLNGYMAWKINSANKSNYLSGDGKLYMRAWFNTPNAEVMRVYMFGLQQATLFNT